MYPKTKVYSDGRHYIAIPHTENPYRRKRVKPKDKNFREYKFRKQTQRKESKNNYEKAIV